MSKRYIIQETPEGWAVIDPRFGTPVMFDEMALTGLKREYAVEISEILSLIASLLDDEAGRTQQPEKRKVLQS